MIKNILIEALNYFWKLFNIIAFFIIILWLYIITFIKGKQIGKKIMKTKIGEWITERFKR